LKALESKVDIFENASQQISVDRKIALFLIRFYRAFLSPYFGGACRFHPTCSSFALDVFSNEPSLWVAFKLVFFRLLRCRPGGPSGYDPAPGVKSP
jgi:putative membrane protein insertion efficiency factor